MNHFSGKRNIVYLITTGAADHTNFSAASAAILDTIRRAAEAKVQLVQIREKKLSAKLVFELVSRAVTLTRNTDTKILVNDRADIALAANAGGVHLTSRSLPVKIIRQNFPPDFIVGVSAHSLADAGFARSQGADFVTFSPIFKTPSKEIYGAPQGLEKLREVCRSLHPFPVLALGGVNEDNFRQALANGASGFAAIRFLNARENLLKLRIENEEK